MADGKSYNSRARKKDGTTSSLFYKLVFFLVKVVFGTKPVPHIEPGDFDNAESPYIMLSNHESFTDFCYLYRLARKDKPLFVVNRLYTLMPFLSFLSRRIGMIPKKVFYDDPNASVKIMRTLKRGTPVIIFPEGRLCIDGRSNAIPEPGGAFYKRLGVDIVLVQISGAFYEKPKWRKKRYRTPVNITVKRVLKKDEIAKMSAEEIGNIIVDTISHKAPDEAFTTYPQKDKAEGLHNILYRCYSCDGLYTTRSGGNRITCDKCGKTFELGDDYRFKSEPYTIANWYDHITEIERKNIREIDLKADVTAKIRSKNGKVRKEHGRARLTFNEFTYESENVSVRYRTENMNAMLFTAGDHFEIYHNDEMYFLCPDEQPQQSARWAHAVDIMCAIRKESQRTVKE